MPKNRAASATLIHSRADDEQIIALLKRTMPFQVVPESVLRDIAGIARRQSFTKGTVIYDVGDRAEDIFVIMSGRVEHVLGPGAQATNLMKIVGTSEVIGWAALLKNQPQRLAKTTCLDDTEVLRINAEYLLKCIGQDPVTADVVMSRFATMITQDFTVPDWLTLVRDVPGRPGGAVGRSAKLTGLALTMYRISLWAKSPKPYLMLMGFGVALGFWHMAVTVWQLPRFENMPGLVEVIQEWTSEEPVYGLSLYTPEYYTHIWVSVRRVATAFVLATVLGVSLGLFLGWSKSFREYVFPVFETLRPIPILAWVPLAILMFSGSETPVIFLTFLASFYATALNTMLGVESIDESYIRAAYCLGAKRWQVFRQVVVPGALPFIFTGLQISVGVAWFSLVAAEMVSGQYGLGYVINTSYTMVRYPTIVIGMITLGAVGYVTSAMVRMVGDRLMQWRIRELALGGRS